MTKVNSNYCRTLFTVAIALFIFSGGTSFADTSKEIRSNTSSHVGNPPIRTYLFQLMHDFRHRQNDKLNDRDNQQFLVSTNSISVPHMSISDY